MKIRPYHEGDDAKIVALIQEVLDEYGIIDEDVSQESDLQDIPAYFDFSNGGGLWVLDDEGQVVGTIGLHRLDDESCYFSRFYVKKEYRGEGWGSKLWHHRAEYLKTLPYKRAYATSFHAFVEALEFYKTHGYEEIKKENFPVETRWADKFFVKQLD